MALFLLYGSPGLATFDFKSQEGLASLSSRAAVLAERLSDYDQKGLLFKGSKHWHNFISMLPDFMDRTMEDLTESALEEVQDIAVTIMVTFIEPFSAADQDTATLAAWLALQELQGIQPGKPSHSLNWA